MKPFISAREKKLLMVGAAAAASRVMLPYLQQHATAAGCMAAQWVQRAADVLAPGASHMG